jgi:hypothetical protein
LKTKIIWQNLRCVCMLNTWGKSMVDDYSFLGTNLFKFQFYENRLWVKHSTLPLFSVIYLQQECFCVQIRTVKLF